MYSVKGPQSFLDIRGIQNQTFFLIIIKHIQTEYSRLTCYKIIHKKTTKISLTINILYV